MAIVTWELKDHIYQGSPATTGAPGLAGRIVVAHPAPARPDGHYLLANAADGLLHPAGPPWPSAAIDTTGQFDFPALPCALAGTQEPVSTPWQIRIPNIDGGVDIWQGVPPTSTGVLKVIDLKNGVNGASGWVLVS